MNRIFTAFIEHKEFKRSRPWSVVRQVFDGAVISTPHYAETVEMLICNGISGSAYIGGRKYDMGGKKVLYIPPETVHSFEYEKSDGYLLVVKVHPTLVREFINIDAILSDSGGSLSELAHEHFFFEKAAECAKRLSEDSPLSDSLCAIIEIFTLLKDGSAENECHTGRATESAVLNEIIKFTEANLSRHISLDEVSKRFGYTKNYFCDMFKRYTGITYLTYLNNMRISAACTLLKKGEQVGKVSALVGIETDSYFIKIFKRTVGVTPKMYQMGVK